jgi:hypothetical protein
MTILYALEMADKRKSAVEARGNDYHCPRVSGIPSSIARFHTTWKAYSILVAVDEGASSTFCALLV